MRFSLLLAPFALTLAGCGNSLPPVPEDRPLDGAPIGGDFTLTSETGDTVTLADFAGKYRMVYFGYTFCPDICPFDAQRMGKGYAMFADAYPDLAEKVVPIFVTIDPERDGPEQVAEFTDNFSPAMVGLTGTPEQIKTIADQYVVAYSRGADTPGGYLMDHSRTAILMSPDDEPIALLPVEESAAGVFDVLKTWVR